jgi:5-methylcytosine-specific restriction endonuclease McrA
MSGLPRPCSICGKRVTDGTSKCETHKGQAYRAPISCKVCGKQGPRSYCDEHNPFINPGTEEDRLKRQPWRAAYRDPSYHRERQAILRDAKGYCSRCGRPSKLEVDHIVPLSSAKTVEQAFALNNRSNLRALCVTCHRLKKKRP